MKNGTLYAKRLKTVYTKLKQGVSKPEIPEPDEPLLRLAIGILGVGCSDDEARRALDRAFTTLVDWNEVRVSSAFELHRAAGNALPQGVQRCQQLISALRSIFDRENRMSLDRLKSMGRREARTYLEELKGTDEYSVASVIVWSLGGHAIPVNDRLLEALREGDLIHPSASRAEVQAFLERHVSATDAKAFCIVMRSLRAKKIAASKRAKATATAKKRSGSKRKAG